MAIGRNEVALQKTSAEAKVQAAEKAALDAKHSADQARAQLGAAEKQKLALRGRIKFERLSGQRRMRPPRHRRKCWPR